MQGQRNEQKSVPQGCIFENVRVCEFVVTFKPWTYNKRDNRSTFAITKENNGVHVCQDKELNKGGSTIGGHYTLVCVYVYVLRTLLSVNRSEWTHVLGAEIYLLFLI